MLILLPGQPGLPAASAAATGIRAPLLEALSFRVSIETEHVDVARFASPDEQTRRLRTMYRAKYRDQRFDLIVAASNEPLEFILDARDDLWPHTPVIVCGVDERSVKSLAPPPGVTLLTMRYDMEGTLRAALALLPNTRRVALVGGAGRHEQRFHDWAREAVRAAPERLDLIDLTQLPIADTLARAASLPEDTVILISSYQVDGTGRRFYGVDILGPLVATANRPVFSPFASGIGRGVVGGVVTDAERVGRDAGTLAVRMLRGEGLPASPLSGRAPAVPRFDERQLVRWTLDARRLPASSEVVHRQPTLWAQYRWHIVASLGLIVLQAGLILGLLVQHRRRREAQAGLTERLRFEALVSEVGAVLTSLPIGRTGTQISECLRRIGEFLGVDRASLWQPSENEPTLLVSHGWSAVDVAPSPMAINLGQFPYFRRCIDAADVFHFERLDQLPADAEAERTAFAAGGVRSFLAIPLPAGERSPGFLAFVTLRAERAWPDGVVQQLRVLGEHFASALLRLQSAAAIESSDSMIEGVLAALPGETAIIDASGAIVRVNEAWAAARSEETKGRALTVGANYLDVCRDGVEMPVDVGRQAHAAIEAILRGARNEVALEYRWSRQGQDRWFEMHVQRLTHLGGGAAVMHFDVTARRQAEVAAQRHVSHLAHLDRVASMGQLAAAIAHELNQPLTAVRSNAEAAVRLLNREQPDVDEVRACLGDIIQDDDRAAEVIRRLRRLLKKSEFTRMPLALNGLVTATIGLVSNDALLHEVSLAFEPAPVLPVVYGDLVQIQQVILNLLSNAIAAAAGSTERKVTLSTRIAGGHVELAVHDSGKGIAEGDLERLFDPFFTTKPDGLGMGLAISRAIVDAHGGNLLAENDPAGGAIFQLRLRTESPKEA